MRATRYVFSSGDHGVVDARVQAGDTGLAGGRGADAVIETISRDASLGRALETVRDGGNVAVLGMSHSFQPVDQPSRTEDSIKVALTP